MYLNSRDLYIEIIVSKAQGHLTKEAEKMLILLAKNVIRKMSYRDPDDRLDCLQSAYLDLFSNWHSFNEMKTTNAFAFYTEVIKRGLAKGWNQQKRKKGDKNNEIELISLTGYSINGEQFNRF